MQGLDGAPGDKGDDGEPGQPVRVLYFITCRFTLLMYAFSKSKL